MRKSTAKLVSLLVIMMMVFVSFAGCGSTEEGATETPATDSSTGTESTETEEKDVYPLEGDRTITYWTGGWVHADFPTQGDTHLMQEKMKRTGVEVEFIHQTGADAFSLLVASGDLPDVFGYRFTNFPGGPTAALEQGVVMEMNEHFEKWAPNLMQIYADNPEWDKLVKTDDGQYYNFPFIRGDDYLTVFVGPQARKDWLDDLNLSEPETIDEWYTVLKAFKEEKGATAPLTFEYSILRSSDAFVGAYDASFEYFINSEGEVEFGSVREGFRDFTRTLAKWYEEGLLDQDIATVDRDQVAARMTTGVSGAAVGHTGSRMGAWLTAASDVENYDLVGLRYPTLNKGETAMFGQRQHPYFGQGIGVTSKARDVEAAVRFFDYGYGEEGHMLYNFGIEGKSYEMIDGYPTYTDYVLQNEEGKSPAQMLRGYTQSVFNGPLVQDRRYMEQYAQYDQQKNAIETWMQTNGGDHNMPAVTYTSEESNAIGAIMSEIYDYRDEIFFRAVLGDIDIDSEWDNYIRSLDRMGLQDVLAVQQDALDRYNNR